MSDNDSKRLLADIERLKRNGLILPKHPARAMNSYGDAVKAAKEMRTAAGRDLDNLSARLGRTVTADNYNDAEVQKILGENQAMSKAMGDKRAISHRMQRTSSFGPATSIGGDAYNAIPRFYDPLEYWDLAGIPWNVADEGHRHKLHKWMRLYYATHYLIPILVDIFTRFPLVGMELEHKDPQLKEVYENIFLGSLKYEEFLVSLGREFWLVGEAFPLGSFDEDLGVFDHEELINPEDVVIDNFPLLDSKQLKIVPPDYLKRIAQTKSPAREWYMLKENYEDLIPYLLKGEHIPISPVLLGQVANKLNDWDDHGTPILLRGLRTLLHEEKLLASQDAIAERLYSPFILAKLGIMDMGDNLPPWLPGPDELQSVRDDIDIALASDFRVLVHHFGLELESVFGREQMPRLGDDFDRIERRLMQVFGVNPSLLSAGSNSQPYASSALQAEFMNQILRTFQKMLKDHFKERALVIAEAQGHQEYERKGQTRIPVFEKIVVFNEDGEKEIKKVPKLTVPDLNFATFDLRDEATERDFLQRLRAQGVPIPDDRLLMGVDWPFKQMVDEYNTELKEKTIAQQEAKMETYIALTVKGLPVPLDLKAECESVLLHGAGAGGGIPQGGAGPAAMGGGSGGPPGGPGGGPGGTPVVMPPPPPGLNPTPGGPGSLPPGGGPPATSPTPGGAPGTVPPVSNERRPGLKYNTRTRKVARSDSPFAKYAAAHPELGVPFQDFVEDESEKDLDKIRTADLDDLLKQWPEKAAIYQSEVLEEIAHRVAQAMVNEEQAATITQTVEEYVDDKLHLSDNQTLVKNAGEDAIEGLDAEEYIVEESKTKTPVVIEAPKDKKYAYIDPLAGPVEDKDDSAESKPEPSG